MMKLSNNLKCRLASGAAIILLMINLCYMIAKDATEEFYYDPGEKIEIIHKANWNGKKYNAEDDVLWNFRIKTVNHNGRTYDIIYHIHSDKHFETHRIK